MTQTLSAVAIALIAVALLIAMSLRANRRLATQPRLPMQWWLDGAVTWTAPRGLALALMPVLAAVCLAAVVALTIFGSVRAGQEDLVLPVNILVALTFLGLHALHLWLIERTVRREN